MNETTSDAPTPALTIGGAARRLGVAVETLRSWERRYGLGPRRAEPGRHRRYTPADLARLERFCRLVGAGAAAPEAARAVLSGGERAVPIGRAVPIEAAVPIELARLLERSGGAAARGLARCAVRLDTPATLELLEAAIARDGVAAAWETTIQPALLAVGRKWTETQGRYVEAEHLLSWCITTALHRVRNAEPPTPTGFPERRVLLACAPGEWHSLPLEVLRAALAEQGEPVAVLGPAVPAPALREAVRRLGPAVVVVWSQAPHTADLSALPLGGGPSRRRVLPAGPGWAAARPAAPSALLSLTDALAVCLG